MTEWELAEEVLLDGTDDWVMATDIASVARVQAGLTDPRDVRELSLRLVEALILSGLMEAGDVKREEGFQPWRLPPEDCVRIIRQRWPADRFPEMGDICWLRNTEAGDARAREVGARSGPNGRTARG